MRHLRPRRLGASNLRNIARVRCRSGYRIRQDRNLWFAVFLLANIALTVIPAVGQTLTPIEYLHAGGGVLAEIHNPPAYFTDVAGQSYAAAANLMYADGISAGCGGTTFCATATLTRGDMAILIMRAIYTAAEGPANTNAFMIQGTGPGQCNTSAPVFADVPPSAYYYCAVQRLSQLGITAGCGGTPPNFCPTSTVTNSDVTIFAWRGAACAAAAQGNSGGVQSKCAPTQPGSYPSAPYFSDVHTTDYFFPFVQYGVASGVFTTTVPGCAAGNFCPFSGITRGTGAVWIVRYILGDFDM